MEEGGGNKRRGGSSRQEQEQPRATRDENVGSVSKKVLTRETPKWLPHATSNSGKGSKDGDSSSKRLEDGAERIQTITDSQRRFAARFSNLAAESGEAHTVDTRTQGGSRWSSRSERLPSTPGGSPSGSRWLMKSQSQDEFGARRSLSRGAEGSSQNQAGKPKTEASSSRQSKEEGTRTRGRSGDSVKVELGDKPSEEGAGQGSREKRAGDERSDAGDKGQSNSCSKASERSNGASKSGKASSSGKPAAGLVKGPWTKEEDQKIIDCITQNITKWSEIAERVEGRVGKQCRERWFNHLDPSLKKSSWTAAEDDILVQGQARFGNRFDDNVTHKNSWTKIAKLLPGRSENAVKNRWNSAARKKGKADPRNSIADMAKMNSGMPGNGPMASEFIGHQQVPILPESRNGGQMRYIMVPAFHPACHMKPQGASPAAWPTPSLDMQGHMRSMVHGGMPVSMLQQAQSMQQLRPEQSPSAHDPSGMFNAHASAEQAFAHLMADPPLYGQSALSQAGLPPAQRALYSTLDSHGKQPAAAATPTGNVSAMGAVGVTDTAGARPAADGATKRDPNAAFMLSPPEGQASTDPKGDSFFGPEDELSLSNTLFNLSFSKNSFGAFTHSFGKSEDIRQDLEGIGGPHDRQAANENREGRDFSNGTPGASFSDRAMDSFDVGMSLSSEQPQQPSTGDTPSTRPRMDFTASVSELLFAPTQARTGDYAS